MAQDVMGARGVWDEEEAGWSPFVCRLSGSGCAPAIWQKSLTLRRASGAQRRERERGVGVGGGEREREEESGRESSFCNENMFSCCGRERSFCNENMFSCCRLLRLTVGIVLQKKKMERKR